MKRTYIFAALLTAGLAMPAAAQTPTQPPTTNPKPTSPTTPGTQTPATPQQPVTITGCLTPPAPGTPNTGYTLSNATGADKNAAPRSYALLGGDPNALIKYGNSRVEIIGSMDPQPAGAFKNGSTIGQSPIGAGATGAVGTSGSGATPVTGATNTNPKPTTPPPAAGSVTMGTPGTPGAANPATPAMGVAPNFHVTSMRQVPGGCGGTL